MELTIKFRGIDRFNRPVYKVIEEPTYYGSTSTLFDDDATEEEVNGYFNENLEELEYFGNHFGCEPNGGRTKNLVLKIITT